MKVTRTFRIPLLVDQLADPWSERVAELERRREIGLQLRAEARRKGIRFDRPTQQYVDKLNRCYVVEQDDYVWDTFEISTADFRDEA